MKKQLPKFKNDSDIEKFLDRDLSDHLVPENFQTVTFEFEPKEKMVNLRMSKALFESIKSAAQKKKIPYQRYIRQALENSVRG